MKNLIYFAVLFLICQAAYADGPSASITNPETGEPWGEPEVPETIDFELLETEQPVSPLQIGPLIAFLEALTDQRYEHLLPIRQRTE